MVKSFLLTVTLFLCFSLPLSAAQAPNSQAHKEMDVVQVEASSSHAQIHPGESLQLVIVVKIKQGFHINSHEPLDKFLMPTVVKLDERDDIVFGTLTYPRPSLRAVSFSINKVSVYEGKISIFARCKLSEGVSVGNLKLSGVLAYQPCNDQTCFMPRTVRFEVPLRIVKASEPIKLVDKDIFQQGIPSASHELRTKQLVERGLPYAVIAFFLFGLALNLTPCAYPVIPMTVSFFISQSERKKSAIFLLALCYVTGIALIFSVLGLISGLAGKQWGFLFQNPWVVIFITMIILSMAASMFGAFELSLPSPLMTKLAKSRQGVIGSFIMGLTVGVVIAPCAAGVVIGLVSIIAKLGIIAKGALFFFVMGLGLGLPYLFLATFSGLLSRLPKSGMWMVWIRKLFGLILIGVAIYFLLPQAKQVGDQQGFYLGVLGIFGGLLLGFLGRGEGYTRGFTIIRVISGLLLILSGVLLVNAVIQPEPPVIDWVYYRDQPIENLQEKNRPVLIEFYADWCVACKRLDRKTFRDQRVVEKSREFVMVRVDCTSPDNKCTPLAKKFKVVGLPTVVLISATGKELRDLRAVGFLGPVEMLKKMEWATAQ